MRILLALITFFAFYVSSFAAPISESVARDKAVRFMTSKKGDSSAARSALRNGGSAILGASLTAVDNQRAYYVFNVESSNGYIIVSGDDRMPDVLGYSYSGSYNRDSIPDNMKAWLQGYADEYQYLQSHSDAKAASLTSVTGSTILPMVPTYWDQEYPYNTLCPTIQGQSTVTGCVATAMSQIMYYHQWPEQTTKMIPAYTTKTSIKMPAIEVTTIEWDNMSQMNQAVANLMLMAGCSVKMNYGLQNSDGTGGSGANVADVAGALKDYFDYKNTISYIQRDNYSYGPDAWNQMVYNELKNERPVIYGGQSSKGGHAFIIDGYDQDDYFHVNWGWGGYNDGYFLLTSLNGYNTGQEIVIGIEGKGNPEHKYAYAVLEDDVLTFCYDNERETRTGTMFNVYSFDWTGKDYCDSIATVKFDSSFVDYPFMTNMHMMFYNMKNLTTIEGLTNLNTQNVTDMYALFCNCSKLDSLDLGNFNTENVTDMYYMFRGCNTLSSLDLSSFDTRNVTNMNAMFFACQNLKSLDVSSFDTQNVTDMYGMFYKCEKLDSLDLSNFNTENVTNMRQMFSQCSNLKSLDVSSFDTKNITNMDDMFRDCSKLTSLDLSNFNTENVTSMDGTFYNCTELKSVNLSNFNTRKVNDMYYMFCNCNKLTSLDLSSFDTRNVTNMAYMFTACNTLDTLDLSSFDTRNVTNMAYMFYNCTKLASLDLSSFDTRNVTNMYGMFAACSTLDTLDLSSFDTRNVTNMAYMFTVCQNVEKIYVDEGWTTENVQSSDRMFNGCWKLVGQDGTEYDFYKDGATYAHYKEDGYLSCWPKAYAVLEGDTLTFYYDILRPERTGTVLSMDIFEWTGETYRNDITNVIFDAAFAEYKGLTSTARMFSMMENLTTIDGFEYLNTENVTDMSAMFSGCQSLDSLDLSNFDTKNVTDMSWMFGICQSLTSLNLGSFDTGNVTKMNAMFSGCENLEALYIGGFNTENVIKMNSMFTGCKKLSSLSFRNFDTGKVEDMNSMFSDCQAITSLDVSTFDTKNVTRMDGMFSGCQTLSSLDLYKFDTKNVTRMDNMFKECLELTTIYVGDEWNTENVEKSDKMFLDCLALVGQDSTTYDADSTDKAKAHYDEGGYLTYKPLYLRGDANGDGVVDKDDVKFVSDIILGVQSEEYDFKAADANGDGVINMPDIMFIVNYVLNGKFPESEVEPKDE